MRATATTQGACAPGDVFDTLADLRNETRWNSRVSSAELRSDEPIGSGSRFSIVNGGTPYDVTIMTYERPSRLVLEARGQPDLTITYALSRSSTERSSRASSTSARPECSSGSSRCSPPVVRRDPRRQLER